MSSTPTDESRKKEREYRRKWAAANPDKARARNATCQRNRRKHIDEAHEDPNKPASVKFLEGRAILSYRSNAKARKLEFNLTVDQAKWFMHQRCHYCGKEPSPLNGIDRKDNDRHYSCDNCVPACSWCNLAKNVHGYDEWMEHLETIAWHSMGLKND